MFKFILKRILIIIPTLLVVTFILFAITSMTPGTPGRAILGITATQEAVDQLNHELGYDLPFLQRFGNYVLGILQGNFGKSYSTGNPVFKEIFARFPATVRVAVFSSLIAAIIGVPLGILSAVKQYSVVDVMSTTLALLMASIPGFWLGLMMMLLFALNLGWLPVSGIGSWQNYVMPTLMLALPSSASIMRMTRTTMLEAIRQDYIRTARAKGAPTRMVIWRHALRNALLPVLTSLSMDFAVMLGGTVIAETVFALPGLGTLNLSAIRTKDMPVVLGSTLFLAALFCLIMLVVDILYGLIDPRVRAKYTK